MQETTGTKKSVSHLDAPPIPIACTCKHDAQDHYYGKGIRLHNPARGSGGKGIKYRCTVCGHVVE